MTAQQQTRETSVSFFPGYKWRPHLKLARVADPERPFRPERGGELTEVVVAY